MKGSVTPHQTPTAGTGRPDVPFPSSIPGLNGFSHVAPEWPESHSLWKPQFGVKPPFHSLPGARPSRLGNCPNVI